MESYPPVPSPATHKTARRKVHSSVKVVFLSLAPRLYILRALIVSSFMIISVDIGWMLLIPVSPLSPGLWIFLYAFIVAHHIIR